MIKNTWDEKESIDGERERERRITKHCSIEHWITSLPIAACYMQTFRYNEYINITYVYCIVFAWLRLNLGLNMPCKVAKPITCILIQW